MQPFILYFNVIINTSDKNAILRQLTAYKHDGGSYVIVCKVGVQEETMNVNEAIILVDCKF